jgi:hypothetical protein
MAKVKTQVAKGCKKAGRNRKGKRAFDENMSAYVRGKVSFENYLRKLKE